MAALCIWYNYGNSEHFIDAESGSKITESKLFVTYAAHYIVDDKAEAPATPGPVTLKTWTDDSQRNMFMTCLTHSNNAFSSCA